MKNTYAVIGAGSGGQAMAAHLTLLGYHVSLCDIDCRKIQLLQERGNITVSGEVEGAAHIAKITPHLEDAVQDCDVILIVTTTDQHIPLAEKLLPLIRENQIVVLCPGQTGGVIVTRNVFLSGGKNIVVAEMQDLIYTCRASELGQVHISALKKQMDLAVCRREDYALVMERIGEIYPQLRQADSLLQTDFDNMGAILHPAPMLLNAGRIESGSTFCYYREGITPSVAAVLQQLDEERLAVSRAYGAEAASIAQWLRNAYGVEGHTLYELFQNNPSYETVKAPTSLNHRYITEDVPCGLVPIAAFGKLAGVQTPMMDSVIDLAGSLLFRDFRAEGRNLKCLGLDGFSVSEIKNLYL